MRFALLAAAALSVSLAGLAGCLEGRVSLMTAKEALEEADGAAEAWADDAILANAYGMEAGPEAREEMAAMLRESQRPGNGGMDEMEMDEASDDERTMLAAVAGAGDDVPGDGRAPVWVFTYVSEASGDSLEVAVTGEGVAFEREGDGDGAGFFGNRGIDGWRIDSDEGAAVAREDSGYGRAADDPRALAFTILVQGEDSPIWLFGVETDGDSDEAFVAVDAATGEAVDPGEVLRALVGFTMREASSFAGTLAAPDTSFGGGFSIEQEGHGLLVVLVSVSPPPVVPMRITVTDPAGTTHEATLDPAVGIDATGSVIVIPVLPGNHDVDVQTDAALLHDWEVSWCTDGVSLIPMTSRACELVDASGASAPAGSRAETLSWPGRWLGA